MRALRTYRPQIAAALAIVFLTALAAAPAAADGWWPGGAKDKPETDKAVDESAMVDSSMFKLSWPKVQMPKFSWKQGAGEEEGMPSAVTPEGNPISRALDKVSDSSKRAANNVREAWGAAVEKLSFGGGEETQVAQNDKPGFWSRIFGPAEEPRQAETVQEFLAQERVGTTR